MSRLFDPVSLMNDNVEANATRRDPLPIGETTAQITEMKFKDGEYLDKETRQKKTWTRLDFTLEITDPEYLAQIGDGLQPKAITFYGVMLDMSGGAIATGPNKNIKLGRMREATGTNGQPLNMMNGKHVRIMIGNKPHPTEPDTILDEVVGVTKVE